jgi:hypothetical protein
MNHIRKQHHSTMCPCLISCDNYISALVIRQMPYRHIQLCNFERQVIISLETCRVESFRGPCVAREVRCDYLCNIQHSVTAVKRRCFHH